MEWSFIDKVVYINLDDRIDRKEHMEKFIKPFGDKVIRMSAIKNENGSLGCSMSHIVVLKMAIQNQWKNILVLEDDCEWNKYEVGYKNLVNLVKNPYDVILLGGSFSKYDSKTSKLFLSCATSSYLVNSHYYEKLLNNFELGCQQLNNTREFQYLLDRYWNILIEIDNWFIVLPNLIYQKADFSSIENKFIDLSSKYALDDKDISVEKIFTDLKYASWGTSDYNIDVTNTIKNLPKNKELLLSYKIFESDPHPQHIKELHVIYNNKNKCVILENNIFSLFDPI